MFYVNGGYNVFIDARTGTKIRIPQAPGALPDFPESVDLKITDSCQRGCAFCHEESSINGKQALLEDVEAFASGMKPGTEAAVGGGNLMRDPSHTEAALRCLKEHGVLPSITLHQEDFLSNLALVDRWRKEGLVYGIGVSLSDSSDKTLLSALKERSSAVLHVIVGLFSAEDASRLVDEGIKILILGYKEKGRGVGYLQDNRDALFDNLDWLSGKWPELREKFAVMAFDNLALTQLKVADAMDEGEWGELYAGPEGDHTMYVNLVERRYAVSSTSDKSLSAIDEDGRLLTVEQRFEKVRTENPAHVSYRHCVFETNSSSVHTLVMCRESEYIAWQNGKLLLDLYNECRLVPIDSIPPDQMELDEEEFAETYATYEQFWDEYSSYYELFCETFSEGDLARDPVIAFGYYGHD